MGLDFALVGCGLTSLQAAQARPGAASSAAAVADLLNFIMQRRLMLECVSSQVKTWSFLSTYDQVIPLLGTTHATDILVLYGGIATGIAPQSEGLMRYINFVKHQDSNTNGTKQLGGLYHSWQQQNSSARNMLNFESFGVSELTDEIRAH